MEERSRKVSSIVKAIESSKADAFGDLNEQMQKLIHRVSLTGRAGVLTFTVNVKASGDEHVEIGERLSVTTPIDVHPEGEAGEDRVGTETVRTKLAHFRRQA